MKEIRSHFTVILCAGAFVGWSASTSEAQQAGAPSAAEFTAPIEDAHGLDVWQNKEAVAADIVVEFGGSETLDAHMIFRTDFKGSRLELENGTVAIYDGETAWVSPSSSPFERARFHLLTWPYFLSAPMKLRDPGTNLEVLEEREMHGKTYARARLTFDPGVGDTPEDWYVLYRDPETKRLAAMAYVVTYGTSLEKAEEEPHIVTYHDFERVEGVQIPMRWQFWNWSEKEGAHGEPIGEVTLERVRFVSPASGAFTPPEGARKAELPGHGT